MTASEFHVCHSDSREGGRRNLLFTPEAVLDAAADSSSRDTLLGMTNELDEGPWLCSK